MPVEALAKTGGRLACRSFSEDRKQKAEDRKQIPRPKRQVMLSLSKHEYIIKSSFKFQISRIVGVGVRILDTSRRILDIGKFNVIADSERSNL